MGRRRLHKQPSANHRTDGRPTASRLKRRQTGAIAATGRHGAGEPPDASRHDVDASQ